MTKTVVSERFQPKYARDSATIRHAMERSVLYSEELGIGLAQHTSTGSCQAFSSVPELPKLRPRKPFAPSRNIS
jgi:hypothetical protein